MNTKFFHRHSGFTLVELLVVIAIAGCLYLFVMPAMREFSARNEASAQANRIFNMLRFARSSALEGGKVVTVCKSNDRHSCCTNCNWADGQIVVDSNSRVLLVASPIKSGDELVWQGNLGVNDLLQFDPSGTTCGQQGSFLYCPKNAGQFSRAVIINLKGRIYVSDKTASGEEIKC